MRGNRRERASLALIATVVRSFQGGTSLLYQIGTDRPYQNASVVIRSKARASPTSRSPLTIQFCLIGCQPTGSRPRQEPGSVSVGPFCLSPVRGHGHVLRLPRPRLCATSETDPPSG